MQYECANLMYKLYNRVMMKEHSFQHFIHDAF